MENSQNKSDKETNEGRRLFLKSLAAVPVIGALGCGTYLKRESEKEKRKAISKIFGVDSLDVPKNILDLKGAKKLRVGIIGTGSRGKYLLRGLGFASPEWIDKMRQAKKDDPKNTRYDDFKNQDDLNIEIAAVCDVFDTYANEGIKIGANLYRNGSGEKMGATPVRYKTYQELLADKSIDAVIIATTDHWHGSMARDAALAGKHIYVEKPFCWLVDETNDVTDTVRNSGVVFQLGHQNRQIDTYNKAKEIYKNGLLGDVSLVQVNTNRNDPNGAWVYDLPEDATPQTIDWKQWLGPDFLKRTANEFPFSREHFMRWRCWWDYSTGLYGDLFTHEWDAVNQILGLGIPSSTAASGGIYYYKDGRTVPDITNVVCEYADRNMTLHYSATQANECYRPKVFMGSDAIMEVGSTLSVTPDGRSKRYEKALAEGLVSTDAPMFNYIPGKGKTVDGTSSATELYFAKRGLLYTINNGKRVDTTHLHMREWISAIHERNLQTSCGIEQAYEEAMTAHMATQAYRLQRVTYWDQEKRQIYVGEKIYITDDPRTIAGQRQFEI